MKLKPFAILILFFLLGAIITQCTSTKSLIKEESSSKIAPMANLTQSEAELRSQLISEPTYLLKFDFENDGEQFQASSEINFKLSQLETTFLDFRLDSKGEITSFFINEKPVSVRFENFRIVLPKEDLSLGRNKIVITYRQSFSKNGRGIYRFQDPEDKKVYLWTKLEPFDANHVFPCFDQPDLKATMATEIQAPKDWKVVFTTLENQKVSEGDKTKWVFPPSPLMSTYLFSIHAGHYEVWKDQYKNIPLRLFVRASLKKYVDAPFWFSITKKGFRFFEKEFDYPYPFKKYDQLIVPEFSSGGMENIAAVNYNERFVTRGKPSRVERESLANVLLHEMAHMWFGDLVTMKWWDELWLNESFATYMAYTASERATEFKDAWITFQRRNKLSAYIEDQYPTTHPISTNVLDINATFNQFDAITYSKGASSMRQLAYFIGEENFRKGIQVYFKKYAYKNTTLAQFISALEESSKLDLRAWSIGWLRNSGIDTISAIPECKDSKLTSMSFKMTPPQPGEQIRPHRIPFRLFKWENNKMKSWTIEDWKSDRSFEVRKVTEDMDCPDFILPNATDVTYIKMLMTPLQMTWAQSHLEKIESDSARSVFWNQAYLNLRDGSIKIDDFVKLLASQLPKEKNQNIKLQFFTYWSALSKYLPQKTDLELTIRSKLLEPIEDHFWNQLIESRDPLWKKTLLTSWTERVETSKSQNRLVNLLEGTLSLKPLVMDQDLQWRMAQRLSILGHLKSDKFVSELKASDTTETGFKSYLSAQAAKPNLSEKVKWLNEMVRPENNWSLARKQSVLFSLFPSTPNQNQLRAEFNPQFYSTMSELNQKGQDLQFSRSYTDLAPSECDNKTIAELDAFISNQEWNPVIRKNLVIQNSENKICARVRSR